MSKCTLQLTDSQRMALLEIIIHYMTSAGPQEFTDSSLQPPATTTSGELLKLVAESSYQRTAVDTEGAA